MKTHSTKISIMKMNTECTLIIQYVEKSKYHLQFDIVSFTYCITLFHLSMNYYVSNSNVFYYKQTS